MAAMAIDIDLDFTDATLPVVMNDSVIDKHTRYVLDAGDLLSWGQGSPAAGQKWSDLGPIGADAVIASSGGLPGFAGGGFVFDEATANQRIDLPSSAKIAPSSVGFAAAIWIKSVAPVPGSAAVRIGGWHNVATGPWGFYAFQDRHALIADGATSGPAVSYGTVHQLAVGRVRLPDGTFQRRFYIDGLPFASSASGSTAAQPSTPIDPASLGDHNAMNVAQGYNGTV